jgi:hypothetical protein
VTASEPETVALNLSCAECGRSPQRGEVWSAYYADLGEAVTYCPECASTREKTLSLRKMLRRWVSTVLGLVGVDDSASNPGKWSGRDSSPREPGRPELRALGCPGIQAKLSLDRTDRLENRVAG